MELYEQIILQKIELLILSTIIQVWNLPHFSLFLDVGISFPVYLAIRM